MALNSLFSASDAYAQTTAGSAPAAGGAAAGSSSPLGGGMGGMLLPLIAMFAIMYFLILRPQSKKQKEMQKMLGALKKGDRVVTSGGIYGVIVGLSEREATIEISPKVRIKMLRSHIGGKAGQDAPAIEDSAKAASDK